MQLRLICPRVQVKLVARSSSILILKQGYQIHILPFVWLENADSYTLQFHDKMLYYLCHKGALNNLSEDILDHQV
jgi:hypothetical protein